MRSIPVLSPSTPPTKGIPMFNVEAIVDTLTAAIIDTEAATTRALAEHIRKLPAGFPPSEIADMLDAIADEVVAATAATPNRIVPFRDSQGDRVDAETAARVAGVAAGTSGTNGRHWRHRDCPTPGDNVLNPHGAIRCRGCGNWRQDLEQAGEVELIGGNRL